MFFNLLREDWKFKYARFWFNEKRRRGFYYKVAELYSNNVKLDDIVKSLHRRSVKGGKNKDGVEPWIYQQIMRGMSLTGTLSNGTKKFVPLIDQLLITAGEQSGDLSKVLGSAAELNAKMGKVKGMVRKAVTYPILIMVMVAVVICWFGNSLFPTMVDFLPIDQWPAISRNMYGFSLFMINFWPLVLAAFIGLIILVWWSFPNFTGPVRLKLDKIPPWSLYRLSQGGAWIMSIAAMVASGTKNSDAIQIVYSEAKKNRWLRERTKAVHDNISRGASMGRALTTRFEFPDGELCEDMVDYAGSGNFNNVFEKVGREWIDTSIEKVEDQTKLLNGVAILTALLTIAILAQSMVALMMTFTNMLSMPQAM